MGRYVFIIHRNVKLVTDKRDAAPWRQPWTRVRDNCCSGTIVPASDLSRMYINPHFRVLETASVLLWGQCGNSERAKVKEWSSTVHLKSRLHRNHRDTRRPRPPISASGYHSKSLGIADRPLMCPYKSDANVLARVLLTMILERREDEF